MSVKSGLVQMFDYGIALDVFWTSGHFAPFNLDQLQQC